MSNRICSRRGVTLIELLMAIVIGAIAMFSLAPLLIAEGNFFRKGKRQTEAQRDAQMALRAIARVARGSDNFNNPGPSSACVPLGGFHTLQCDGGGVACIRYNWVGDALSQITNFSTSCTNHPNGTVTLIDGVRSKVTSFLITSITSKQVQVQINVTHQLRTGDPRIENELLQTELFMRNAS